MAAPLVMSTSPPQPATPGSALLRLHQYQRDHRGGGAA